jgi:hypothetical protein
MYTKKIITRPVSRARRMLRSSEVKRLSSARSMRGAEYICMVRNTIQMKTTYSLAFKKIRMAQAVVLVLVLLSKASFGQFEITSSNAPTSFKNLFIVTVDSTSEYAKNTLAIIQDSWTLCPVKYVLATQDIASLIGNGNAFARTVNSSKKSILTNTTNHTCPKRFGRSIYKRSWFRTNPVGLSCNTKTKNQLWYEHNSFFSNSLKSSQRVFQPPC